MAATVTSQKIQRATLSRVEIDRRYTYETNLDLAVGDEVVCPDSGTGQWIGRVTSLRPKYTGACKRLIRKVDPLELEADGR